MSLQPALDQIAVEAMRRGLDPLDAEMTWEPAADGRGVHVEFAFPNGCVLKGYAPDGMASFAPIDAGPRASTAVNMTIH
jgi:hypothetical protein